jgi:hypothetical protein
MMVAESFCLWIDGRLYRVWRMYDRIRYEGLGEFSVDGTSVPLTGSDDSSIVIT